MKYCPHSITDYDPETKAEFCIKCGEVLEVEFCNNGDEHSGNPCSVCGYEE